ncbi:MAG: FHA domain-containing protein [Dehalococcoidia bacterium]
MMKSSCMLWYLDSNSQLSEKRLENKLLNMGRDESNDLKFEDRQISRHHARIEPAPDDEYLIRDLESTNGTFLNEEKLGPEPRLLEDQDRITLGVAPHEIRLAFTRGETIKAAQEKFVANPIENLGVVSDQREHVSPTNAAPVQSGDTVRAEQEVASPLTLTGNSSHLALEGIGLELDLAARELRLKGQLMRPPLTKRQFDMLALLWRRNGQACTLDEIAATCWRGRQKAVDSQEIHTYVHRIRKALRAGGLQEDILHNVRGYGYKLQVTPN